MQWQAYWGTLARSRRELGNASLVSGTSEEIGNLCAGADLAVVNRQFPAEPLQWLPQTLRLPWEEGMRLLQEAGFQACHPASEAVTSMASHFALTAVLLTIHFQTDRPAMHRCRQKLVFHPAIQY